ncbi:helix-turn-helix transcriptional regulator [Paenibacillus sp. VMFN-D1]|uniref:helix-turn-helix domain-containing protein n=1 Tax=Paenibacillus sp. VMFN-D1 TaxID=2135608 RepID=UPI000E27E30D|nr:helix-turn-helix transcriptional regulator [Paenibacillus sp. VMFN-D1]RED32410.1 transcriptional regulator [Paenibacillus sp. VMFN-D1]
MAYKVVVVLKELLEERDISLNELSLRADVRRAAISELSNGKRENINFEHLAKIAEALEIKDINKILKLVEIEDNEK